MMTASRPPAPAGPHALLGRSMGADAAGLGVRHRDGRFVPLPVDRWLGEATPEERALLTRARGPVLDVGCGPGRHVAALHEQGVAVLGIDVLDEAITRTRARGAPAVRRSVFGDVPAAGAWATALLLDGNVGIGGDPVVLMQRVRTLLRPAGTVLVEIEGAGVHVRADALHLEGDGGRSARIAWGRVGRDGIAALCAEAGFALVEVWSAAGRHFAECTAVADTR